MASASHGPWQLHPKETLKAEVLVKWRETASRTAVGSVREKMLMLRVEAAAFEEDEEVAGATEAWKEAETEEELSRVTVLSRRVVGER